MFMPHRVMSLLVLVGRPENHMQTYNAKAVYMYIYMYVGAFK